MNKYLTMEKKRGSRNRECGIRPFWIALLLLITLFQVCGLPAAFGNTNVGSSQRTVVVTSVSASGTVASGARSVQFIFSTDFTGTIQGVAYSGATDAVQQFTAPFNDTLGAITYTRSAGTIRIAVVR